MGKGVSAALRTFLHGETDAASFHHTDHVRMAFEILSHHPNFVTAATAYSSSLRKIAARAGNANAYHETITLAFLSLIAERMASASFDSFAAFAVGNADLLDKGALTRWYSAERLGSPVARATFVLPTPNWPPSLP
jgi:hypothetical protein